MPAILSRSQWIKANVKHNIKALYYSLFMKESSGGFSS